MTDETGPQDTYAVIGVGALAEAIVTGLCEGQTSPPRVVLSPRSRKRADALASTFDTVTVAADNQEAVTEADVVLVCVRPPQAEEALSSLTFRDDQRVVSVMASLPVARLQELCAPATEVSRAIPDPIVADRKGLTPVFPPGSEAERLFDGLGESLAFEEERSLDAASIASATVASHLAYLVTTSEWLAGQGVDPTDANRLIASIFAGVGDELRGASDLASLAEAHTTPGGVNERLEKSLRGAGVFSTLSTSLDDLFADLQAVADQEQPTS